MSAIVEPRSELGPMNTAHKTSPRLSLEVIRGGTTVTHRTFECTGRRTIKIGTLRSADIRLGGDNVARMHAAVIITAGEAHLIDIGTRAGTFLNGERVHKARLADGDVIQIGDAILRISFDGRTSSVTPLHAAAIAPKHQAPAGDVVEPIPMQPMATVVPLRPLMPRFDAGAANVEPVRRIDARRLAAPAVESRPHPALPPEKPVTPDSRALEMRVFWGEVLLDIHHYVHPKRITIGESKRADVFLSSQGLPVEIFPLIRSIGDEIVLTVTADMEGEVEHNGQLRALSELVAGVEGVEEDPVLKGARRIELPTGARAVVHWGNTTFAFRFVSPPRAVSNPLTKNLDLPYLNTLLMSLFIHLTLAVTLLVYPYDVRALKPKRDFDADFEIYRELAMVRWTPPTPPKKAAPAPKPRTTTAGRPGPRNAKPTPGGDRRTVATRAEIQGRFNRMFKRGGGAMFDGDGGASLAGILENVVASRGQQTINARLRGFNTRGDGPYVGNGFGKVRGAGVIVTRGPPGEGDGGSGRLGSLGPRRNRIKIDFLDPDIRDPLDRSVIARVVKQNRRQIRYCYEKQLQAKHDLRGKVLVSWVIGATGKVARVEIQESTIDDAAVESCIVEKIGGWLFPQPAGGGTVRVNYPFVFNVL